MPRSSLAHYNAFLPGPHSVAVPVPHLCPTIMPVLTSRNLASTILLAAYVRRMVARFTMLAVLVGCDLGLNFGFVRLAAGAEVGSPEGRRDWPQWRGPGGRAVLETDSFPESWPESKPQPAWQVRLGTGWSSPVVADGRVFITDRAAGRSACWLSTPTPAREIWTKYARR